MATLDTYGGHPVSRLWGHTSNDREGRQGRDPHFSSACPGQRQGHAGRWENGLCRTVRSGAGWGPGGLIMNPAPNCLASSPPPLRTVGSQGSPEPWALPGHPPFYRTPSKGCGS